MIDLRPDFLDTLKRLLAEIVPGCEVRIFGSRYRWTATDASDLDLALVGAGKLHWKTMTRLKAALEESSLPYRVDVLDWHAISPEFQEVIEQGYEVIQKPGLGMSSNGWLKVKIEDSIIEIIDGDRGVNYPKQDEFFENEYCLFLNAGNVTTEGFIFEKIQFITREKDELLRKGKLRRNDIVLTTRGTVGNVAYFHDSIRYDNIRINSGMVIFRIDESKKEIFTKYFYYCLKSLIFKEQILSHSSGSAQPQLPIKNLKLIEISLPPFETQRRIADILSALDEKIELNRQTNATLEAIAQAIFKEWFVDFNFPLSEPRLEGLQDYHDYAAPLKSGPSGNQGRDMVESELGMIPRGWRVGKLDEIVEFIKGVSYQSSDLQPSNQALVTLKSINRGGGLNFDGFKEFTGKFKESQVLVEGDLVISQTDITQNANVVGCPAIVENPFNYEKLIASLDLVKCKPKSGTISSETLFYFLRQQDFKDYCLSHTNGSTVLHLRSSELPNYIFVIPDEKTLREFGSIVNSIRLKIINSNVQSQSLIQIRNGLLPKLMSGEVEEGLNLD